ncbi:I78 family peptidase inhibitor [Sphingomicrobium marinum]|uniref:I78 family peptidase inhibitor n=1 Tax=Sphingomicrobium marinum TaxID=1227950 RepID=UPI00223FF7A9|nr:I78 family peptidase inhibitor [Sphingomicrobium marinum]
MRVSLIIAPLALMACAVPEMDEPPIRGADGSCSTEELDRFIGQKGTQELAAEMQSISGARIFRWAGHDMVVTADYRPDRLTVYLDEAGNIAKVDCG